MLESIIHHQRSCIPSFEDKARISLPSPSQRSLIEALNQKGRGYILECKKASPSKGLLCADYDPIKIANIYEPFAAAISVLTNEPFFQGSLEDLQKVSNHVRCPVLCKDIIVHTSQVKLARAYGADAILLMLCVLEDETYLEIRKEAEFYHLDVITEVHTKEELLRALQMDAQIIGINHRDFKTMQIDFEVSKKLAPLIPKDKIVIAESGIQTHQDILSLLPFAENFLIGSSLTQNKRPDIKLRELLFGQVKVCGLTSKQAAQSAYQAGASLGGLNFIPSSPRYISPKIAADLIEVPLQWVGVFQNHTIDEVSKMAEDLALSAVQLHGQESITYIETLAQKLHPKTKIFKAVTVNQLEYAQLKCIDKLIIDSQVKDQFGGTGQRVDVHCIPTEILEKCILAGGLSPKNIHEVMHIPFAGFDINSGVESAPGIKCPDKIKQFFNTLTHTNKVAS